MEQGVQIVLVRAFWVACVAALPVAGGTGLGLQREIASLQPTCVGLRPTVSERVIAQTVRDAGSYQAPVKEGEELPDSLAADAARGEAESQMPAVEQPPAGAEVPRADQPPEVPQPGATP